MADIPGDITINARAVAVHLFGDLWRSSDVEIIAEVILAERRRCVAIARRREAQAINGSECSDEEDPETGYRVCSLEMRGRDCLCGMVADVAAGIAKAIEKGPAE